MIGVSDLARKLGVDDATIKQWIDLGLPVAKKRPQQFDPLAVRQWLIDQGMVQTDRVFRTRDEVAKAFGVTVRKVSHWIADPTFPGKPGDALQKNGHFPENAIREWLSNQSQGQTPLQQELLATKVELEKYKLAEKQGKLIDVEVVELERVRTATIVKEKLKQLAFELVAILPPDTNESIRSQLKSKADYIIQTVCEQVARGIEEDDTQ